MDENHHIDESFKQRFSDLKDHSSNPTEQWYGFESSLNALNTAAVSGGASTILGSSLFKMAASFASVIALAGITTQDIGVNTPNNSLVDRTEVFGISSYDFSNSMPSSLTKAFIAGHRSEPTSPIGEAAPSSSTSTMVSSVPAEELEYYSENWAIEEKEKPSGLRKMLGLSRELGSTSLMDDQRQVQNSSFDPKYYSPISYYARAAIRIGNGESNSRVIDNTSSLNGVLGVGLAYSVAPSTFLSIEANYLRRSGNGIERSKEYDSNPVASAINNSNYLNNDGFSAEEIRVQQSLVATDLNYIHLPVMVHVILNPQSNASIGFYTDYLISVRNESYMIYDSEHYITSRTFLADKRSKKGLNSMRYGLTAGYQHSINSKISIDARALLPISSSYDRSSEYDIEREPNQLVDLNIGLIYKI